MTAPITAAPKDTTSTMAASTSLIILILSSSSGLRKSKNRSNAVFISSSARTAKIIVSSATFSCRLVPKYTMPPSTSTATAHIYLNEDSYRSTCQKPWNAARKLRMILFHLCINLLLFIGKSCYEYDTHRSFYLPNKPAGEDVMQ